MSPAQRTMVPAGRVSGLRYCSPCCTSHQIFSHVTMTWRRAGQRIARVCQVRSRGHMQSSNKAAATCLASKGRGVSRRNNVHACM